MTTTKTTKKIIEDKKLNIYQRLNQVSSELTSIEKGGHNSFQNYDYVTESDLLKQIKPLFNKYGIVVLKSIEDVTNTVQSSVGNKPFIFTQVKILYRFTNIDNPDDYVQINAYGSGADNQDKGLYKAITGANKYMYMKLFDLPTGDDAEKDSSLEKPVVKQQQINSEKKQDDLF